MLESQASGVRCQKFGYFAWKFIDVHLIATENMFTLAGIVPTVRSYWGFPFLSYKKNIYCQLRFLNNTLKAKRNENFYFILTNVRISVPLRCFSNTNNKDKCI